MSERLGPTVGRFPAPHKRLPKLPPASDPRRLRVAVWLTTGALLLALGGVAQWLLLPGYLRLDRHLLADDLQAAASLVERQSAVFGWTVAEHARAPEALAALAAGAAEPAGRSLAGVLARQGVLHVAWVDASGALRAGVQLDRDAGAPLPLSPPARALLAADGPLLDPAPPDGVTGLVRAGDATLLAASRPVPGGGWLAMTSPAGGALAGDLSRTLGRTVALLAPPAPGVSPTAAEPLDGRLLRGQLVLFGLDGRPAALLAVTRPRETYRQGLVALGIGGPLVVGLLLLAATLLDRTARRLQRSQEERAALEARHLAALENAAEGMLLAELATLRVLDANRSARQLLGRAGELVGLSVLEVFGEAVPELPAAVEATREAGTHALPERPLRRPDGSTADVEVELALVRAAPRGFLLVTLRDVTARNRQLRRMRELAYSDPLTGLPNRVYLQEQMQHLLGVAARERWELAFLFLDLDRFKNINDTLGHDAGDELLGSVAERLRLCVREGDVLARLGGDEFAVVLYRAGREDARMVARRIRETLERPLSVRERKVHVSASIGIARYPADGTTVHELAKAADIAMYRAKRNGGGYAFYAREEDPFSIERLELEGELRSDLAAGRLALVYQPVVDLRFGSLREVEALSRWHRRDGTVEAGRFVRLAEELGLAPQLDRLALSAALAQAQAWREAGQPLRVAVNVAVATLCGEGFAEEVEALLAAAELPADCLTLEVTETALLDQPGRAVAALGRLSARGVRIALDDFGSGFASHAHLRAFHLDVLKIDRGLVAQIGSGGRDEKLVASAVALGHSLGLSVVAEGVETSTQLDWLRARGCDAVQGYLCGRPVPAKEVDTAAAVAAVSVHPPAAWPAAGDDTRRTG